MPCRTRRCAPWPSRALTHAPHQQAREITAGPRRALHHPNRHDPWEHRPDLGDLGAARRGDVHRYVLRLFKEPEFADPLDTLSYTWTTTQGIATNDPLAFWAAYTVPVLLVAGEQDALLDPDQSAEEVARAPRGSFLRLAETSHVGLAWSDAVAEALAAHFVGAGG